ncbi:MAG: SMI1/KNR4 family protein [Butyricicoccus pullicaecorum]|nr:SMI1/KNR4 family protein [Butyricicoccus pullicaecorum]
MNIDEIVELYQIPEVGFSENEIIRAEQNIGVNLPSNYRNYLIQYGLAKINYVYNHLVKPKNIKTTYQLIQQDIQKNWENEFLSAKDNMSKYNNDYFLLWQLPVEKWYSITENYIILWSENQGIWTAGYLLKDLQEANPNPPIYISVNDDLITYVKCVDNIELFLKKMFEEARNEMPIS